MDGCLGSVGQWIVRKGRETFYVPVQAANAITIVIAMDVIA
jgi:hypothetical protein